MKYFQFFVLLLCGATTILIGAAILRLANLVPLWLTYTTIAAALVIYLDSAMVARGSYNAVRVGVVLGVAAIIASTNPAHLSALRNFGSSPAISGADITMVIGFYLLPMTYFALFLRRRRKRNSGNPSTGL